MLSVFRILQSHTDPSRMFYVTIPYPTLVAFLILHLTTLLPIARLASFPFLHPGQAWSCSEPLHSLFPLMECSTTYPCTYALISGVCSNYTLIMSISLITLCKITHNHPSSTPYSCLLFLFSHMTC